MCRVPVPRPRLPIAPIEVSRLHSDPTRLVSPIVTVAGAGEGANSTSSTSGHAEGSANAVGGPPGSPIVVREAVRGRSPPIAGGGLGGSGGRDSDSPTGTRSGVRSPVPSRPYRPWMTPLHPAVATKPKGPRCVTGPCASTNAAAEAMLLLFVVVVTRFSGPHTLPLMCSKSAVRRDRQRHLQIAKILDDKHFLAAPSTMDACWFHSRNCCCGRQRCVVRVCDVSCVSLCR